MPRAPRRCPGNNGTCPHLIRHTTYCDEHTTASGWDNSRTGGQGSTRAWRKVRLVVLQRDGHRCRLNYDGCTSNATEVDHIDGIAITGIPRAEALDQARLRAVCQHCHRRRTQQQAADGRRNRRHTRQPERHPGCSDEPAPSTSHRGHPRWNPMPGSPADTGRHCLPGSGYAVSLVSGGGLMPAKHPETRKVLRALDRELAASSARQGRSVVWSAQEQAILAQIASILDRKADFFAEYERRG